LPIRSHQINLSLQSRGVFAEFRRIQKAAHLSSWLAVRAGCRNYAKLTLLPAHNIGRLTCGNPWRIYDVHPVLNVPAIRLLLLFFVLGAAVAAAAQTVTVDANPEKAIAFDPDKALGTSLDILVTKEFDAVFSAPVIKASLSAGWDRLPTGRTPS